MLEPIYAEEIIIGVIFKQQFQWYITNKELWYLDYNKLDQAFENGDDLSTDISSESEREGITVLDEKNAEAFLKRVESFKVDKSYLLSLFEERILNDVDDDRLDFSPSLLVDFDDKKLYSMFPEPASFEEYVPNNWDGWYEDFTNLVPEKEKYWINDRQENLFIL
ncbi:hypothetical protein [Priestia megaterium]|uniref:hypothetical protein n=1 Tax=Priestia megaterium TaxID=1404 RepID=UPI001BE4FF4D|nr:hypothetical protein [Priestia megaterium]MBT2254686.1 hypothetical protein [Priestia megaterium]MBT2278662.1 hypothetical protein [Priestia megaterium]MED4027893.1 hypothetical protein [Priestia megaterium]